MRTDSAGARQKALVICTHLRPSRDKRRRSYYMQPLSGLQVASLIDPALFDVQLYHEDWHGPFDTSRPAHYDLVFLTGLQPDFDRMRQLAYHMRRAGSAVVAGGSICTSFPEFATEFFDAVCAGGVDAVPSVVADFLAGSLQPIYRSPAIEISSYSVDYSLFARSGINPSLHLLEASRGCRFKCSFCVVPAEVGGHAPFALQAVSDALESSLDSAPRWSLRRWYPLILFLDNNFSDDRAHMLQVARLLANNPRVRGWSALVTQNILHDRALVEELARLKCVGLFVGLESLDPDMLRRYRKTQNLSRRFDILDDIAYAERQGISIAYGYLFDPRHQTAEDMERQVVTLAKDSRVPMPVYLSLVAPLAGTESFWSDLRHKRLAPNLLLRELDGETIAYRQLAGDEAQVASFVHRMFRKPWTVVSPWRILLKALWRILQARSWNPVRWYLIAATNLHCFAWSIGTPVTGRSFIAGRDPLDPQYSEHPADLTAEDAQRYFDPIKLTDEHGGPAPWLKPYVVTASELVAPPRAGLTQPESAPQSEPRHHAL